MTSRMAGRILVTALLISPLAARAQINDDFPFREATPPTHDSTIDANLRAGGAVILGKTNLSEWANFRSFESISGWSGIGGQTHNPYGIDRNPCGSSSGSGAAASANFATVSLGTE